MATFFFAFALIAFLIGIMAIGVILQNKPIKGSCGGLAALGMGNDCEICGGDRAKCDEVNKDKKDGSDVAQAQFYDASTKF